jgi:hypothetical protein
MQLQGIRIEYLITGGISIIWILPFLNIFLWNNNFPVSSLSLNATLILIPFAYVFGMISDMAISKILEKPKRKIKQVTLKDKIQSLGLGEKEIIIKIMDRNMALYYSIEVKQTRYRIMRGMVFNLLLLSFWLSVNAILYSEPVKLKMAVWQKAGLLLSVFLLTIYAYNIWKVFAFRFYREVVTIAKAIDIMAKQNV